MLEGECAVHSPPPPPPPMYLRSELLLDKWPFPDEGLAGSSLSPHFWNHSTHRLGLRNTQAVHEGIR